MHSYIDNIISVACILRHELCIIMGFSTPFLDSEGMLKLLILFLNFLVLHLQSVFLNPGFGEFGSSLKEILILILSRILVFFEFRSPHFVPLFRLELLCIFQVVLHVTKGRRKWFETERWMPLNC